MISSWLYLSRQIEKTQTQLKLKISQIQEFHNFKGWQASIEKRRKVEKGEDEGKKEMEKEKK